MDAVNWIAVYGPAGGVIIVLLYFVKHFMDLYRECCRERETRHQEEITARETRTAQLVALLTEKVQTDARQAEAYEALASSLREVGRRLEHLERQSGHVGP